MVLIFAVISTAFSISFICWIDDKKSHLKRVYVHENSRFLIPTFSKALQQHT